MVALSLISILRPITWPCSSKDKFTNDPIIALGPLTRPVMFRIHRKYHFQNTGQQYYLNMKTMHMHKYSESRLLIICMTRIFPPLVASTRGTQ
jgi:hypothetical protein